MRASIACAGHQYSRTSHVMGFNLEKYAGASEDYDDLGMSTQGGESIQVQMSGNEADSKSADGATTTATHPINRLYMVIVSSLKVELRTGSCRVSS